jgi:hypothetical protein
MTSKYFDLGPDDGLYPPKPRAYHACYESHKPIVLGKGLFHGGSCIRPVLDTADVYIGFDHGMRLIEHNPWERQVEQVFYPVTDMAAPSSGKSFIKLVDWSIKQLEAGKTIHAGCIGGHGRTGTFLAALYGVIQDDKDAIEKVRKIYCKKAVESRVQIQFLGKHFGLKSAEPTKGAWQEPAGGKYSGFGNTKSTASQGFPQSTGGKEFKSPPVPPKNGQPFKDALRVFNHMKAPHCMFGSLI